MRRSRSVSWLEVAVVVLLGVFALCALSALLLACASSPLASGFDEDAGDAQGAPLAEASVGPEDDAGAWSPYLRGALAVQSRGCPTCHQSDDPDDGVLSGRSAPLPGTRIYGKNLTPDPETGLGALTDAQLLDVLRSGKDEEGRPLCDTMPRYPEADMSPDEATAILTYLRALKPVHHEIPDGECASSDGGACGGLVAPDASAPCTACKTAPCQANGCFNGYLCDPAANVCRPPPAGCG